MEVSGQLHTPAALSPVPIKKEVGWVPEPVWKQWRGEKFPDPAGNGTPF